MINVLVGFCCFGNRSDSEQTRKMRPIGRIWKFVQRLDKYIAVVPKCDNVVVFGISSASIVPKIRNVSKFNSIECYYIR